MDRWQLWRRVWFRLHRKNYSRRQYALATTRSAASRTRSAPETRESVPHQARRMLGMRHFSFFNAKAVGITQRPKVLHDVDCSNLLTGGGREQYENFSSTCWLEDHLHRFAEPTHPLADQDGGPPFNSFQFHGSATLLHANSSGDLRDGYDDFSSTAGSVVETGDENLPSTSYEAGSSSNGNVNLHRYPYVENNMVMIEPPPYANEPPPSYEEAIAGSNFEFEDENEDFLW